jgi:hypothetical protein
VSVNPYAAPEARIEPGYTGDQGAGVWRIGDVLHVSRHAELPHRCVKCNEPARRPSKPRTFYWHASGWYLLILLSIWIYVIAALIVRKKTELSPGLCDAHASARVKKMWLAFGVFLASLVLGFVVGARLDNPWIAFGGFFGGIIASLVIGFRARIIYPVFIDERSARFKGCGPDFLASLGSGRSY